ncbi:GNAT family N-acetyltransferase [Flavihumibacter cheonanensis]|uniref:GNAT family N-acetyltransferase n=1 Tax=Flavihumibacter cheonanensis TaxID=1442385 RepID=UPI001EF96F2E|nr:GNAT family N-acetyltransferase [Flavihumibacter cheonanensis]MCG7752322.1 GNAT family N-acetyltransferase [Flavihumibacter cheonanensis]
MTETKPPADIRISSLPDTVAPPMDLILMADPNQEQVAEYLPHCLILVANHLDLTVGVLALSPEGKTKAEIKVLAVTPGYRRKGIGRLLLEEAGERARRLGFTELQVCTGNSSIKPFQLYQQAGFELTDVRWNYFTHHYPQPIMEEGIVCKHQLVLHKSL